MCAEKFRPIILAGGSGKRLWPLSTNERPKQFVSLFGDLSLFDLTLQRVNNRDLFKKPIVVTSEKYIEFVEHSLSKTGLEVQTVFLEPESKNTFAALTLPVLTAIERKEFERYMVMPSDHYIQFNKSFYEACSNVQNQFKKSALTLFGVKPNSPSTEYGYISMAPSSNNLKIVNSFIEKPVLEKAKIMFKQPDTLWNAGIFCFEGKWFSKSIESKFPEMYSIMMDILTDENLKQLYFYPSKEKFSNLEDVSFDKAFVESNEDNFVANLEAGWTDLGTWHSLIKLQKDPKHGLTLRTEGDYLKTEKPWGYFEVLLETEFSKVKILSINPNQMLSMQMHRYRSETWYIIQGKATVTLGDQIIDLFPGESISIDMNEKHRVQNFGNEVVEILEIQTGSYFGEDDIIRFDDIYGRKDFH